MERYCDGDKDRFVGRNDFCEEYPHLIDLRYSNGSAYAGSDRSDLGRSDGRLGERDSCFLLQKKLPHTPLSKVERTRELTFNREIFRIRLLCSTDPAAAWRSGKWTYLDIV